MAELVRRFRPTPTDEYLGNPHKGCCTFQHFNGQPPFPGTGWSEQGPLEFPELEGDDPPRMFGGLNNLNGRRAGVVKGYLPSTVSYCRWFWDILEPEEGRYDFTVIDKSLEMCKRRGQTLAVRLMAFGSMNSPQPEVPAWYAAKYPVEIIESGKRKIPIPVHDSPEYLDKWGAVIREFASRYDSNPMIESIDVTYIGPWGEGAGECTREQCARFAQLWQDAFPNTPRLSLVAGDQMRESVERGSGWRCDCFGDVREMGSPAVGRHQGWNHHFDSYPRSVCLAGAQDAWKKGPVHFESCGVPMGWYQGGYDIDFILEQGLKFHGTYFMPKYTELPEPWMDKLEAFCRKLGYRFTLRQALVHRKAPADGSLKMELWIENIGVAPIYRKYDLAIRFRQDDRSEIVRIDDVDIRTWLPGDQWLVREVKIPKGFRPGWVELSAGLVDGDGAARVDFAVKQRYLDRWADMAGFEIT